MTDEVRVKLTYEDAEAMLARQEDGSVHTFVQSSGMLVGTDWTNDQITELLRTGSPELAGGMAAAMGHGIVALHGTTPVFVATVELELD